MRIWCLLVGHQWKPYRLRYVNVFGTFFRRCRRCHEVQFGDQCDHWYRARSDWDIEPV